MANFNEDQDESSLSQDLFALLDEEGLLEYGAHIRGEIIREFLGIELPDMTTIIEFKKAQLVELTALTYIRETLLDQGKYIKAQGEDYRILLPSENALQVKSYHRSADRKYDRASRLSANTPHEAKDMSDHSDSRIALRGSSPRRFDGGSAQVAA